MVLLSGVSLTVALIQFTAVWILLTQLSTKTECCRCSSPSTSHRPSPEYHCHCLVGDLETVDVTKSAGQELLLSQPETVKLNHDLKNTINGLDTLLINV